LATSFFYLSLLHSFFENNFVRTNRESSSSPYIPSLMEEEAESMNSHSRPRRASPDTVAYLRSLPLDLDVALRAVEQWEHRSKNDSTAVTDEEVEFPSELAASLQAVYEIRQELASLAGDELGAEGLEILCRITIPGSPTMARILLHGVGPYAIHLATHRYGSHVLQTILELSSVHLWRNKDDRVMDWALHADAPLLPNIEDVPASMVECIVPIASALQEVATDLAVHICGSHCLRTILCLLGGLQLLPSAARTNNHARRGKAKSKKKKKTDHIDESRSMLTEPRMAFLHEGFSGAPDPALLALLHQLTAALTVTDKGSGPGQLQKWVCHASSGPVFAILVQVWTYYDYCKKDERELLCRKQLQWELAQSTPDRHVGLSRPEPKYTVGSITDTVVRRILCWRTESEQKTYGADVLYGFAGEPRGSHCLEIILRLAPDSVYGTIFEMGRLSETSVLQEYVHDSVSNFVVQTILQTIRTSDQATSILNALEPSMPYILDVPNKRRWILWRVAELAVSFPDCQTKVLSMISDGFSRLLQEGQSSLSETRRKLNKCISLLLQVVPPAQYGDRVVVDIAGTRTMHHLLCFTPELCKDTIKGLLELPPTELELLAKDPFASRCILDVIIESPNATHSVFLSALKRLVAKLKGKWVSVAVDRVGHHTVQKLFMALVDVNDKKVLVEELIAGKNRMIGNNMGRTVLDALEVRVYEMQGESEWSKLIKRRHSNEAWLEEILEGTKPLDANVASKRKASSGIGGGTHIPEKKRVTSSVSAIMGAITIPINSADID
jgi:Pumilio-family RNA binding repeat